MITNLYDVLYRVLHHPFESLQLLSFRQAQDLYAIYRNAFNAFAFEILCASTGPIRFSERETDRENCGRIIFHFLLFRWRAFWRFFFSFSFRLSLSSFRGWLTILDDASRVCATKRRSTQSISHFSISFSFFFLLVVSSEWECWCLLHYSNFAHSLIIFEEKHPKRSKKLGVGQTKSKSRNHATHKIHRKLLRLVPLFMSFYMAHL